MDESSLDSKLFFFYDSPASSIYTPWWTDPSQLKCLYAFLSPSPKYIYMFQEHYFLKAFWEKSRVYRTFLMFDVVTKSMIDVGDIAWDPLKGRKTKKRKYVEGPDSPNLFSLSFHIFPKSVFTQNFWVIFKNSHDLFYDTGLSNEVFMFMCLW